MNYLVDQFQYNHDVNREVINEIRNANISILKVNQIMSHLIIAHHIWLNRMDIIKESSFKPWDILENNKWNYWNDKANYLTMEFLSKNHNDDVIAKKIDYSNSKGNRFQNTVLEICNHIIIHSAYHRGQIATIMRQNNFTPVVTDYIFYQRNQT